ncbi:MAG: lysyl oxidase family protein [Gemmatimonadaceae bacterium]
MRRLSFLAVLALTAACASPDGTAGNAVAPGFSLNDPDGVDLVGMPDLVVHTRITEEQWVVRDEQLTEGLCSVEEGNVTPGVRRVVRFTVEAPNIGDADVFIGSPLAHMDPNGDGSYADQDGLFELATCHGHFHFKNYATYRLIGADGRQWKAAKRGFCMLDTDPTPAYYGMAPHENNYLSCGTVGIDGFQGISSGWADTYRFFLGGQYFVLDGGDGQPVVPPGDYIIEVHVNPPYAPDRRGNCPRVKDPATGLCHQFAESNYANNIGRASIRIPDRVGRDGFGPMAGSYKKSPDKADEIEHAGK